MRIVRVWRPANSSRSQTSVVLARRDRTGAKHRVAEIVVAAGLGFGV